MEAMLLINGGIRQILVAKIALSTEYRKHQSQISEKLMASMDSEERRNSRGLFSKSMAKDILHTASPAMDKSKRQQELVINIAAMDQALLLLHHICLPKTVHLGCLSS